MKLLRRYPKTVVLLCLLVVLVAIKDPVEDWVRAYVHDRTPRETISVSGESPDQLCLTWRGDPTTTQAIQWRTSPEVTHGAVEYRPAEESTDETQLIEADFVEIADPIVVNDPLNHRFLAELTGLAPGTTYEYRVGSPNSDSWSEWHRFDTAPAEPTSFSFMYFGDVQEGFDFWGELQAAAIAQAPESAFALLAGDLVNRGNDRDEWDAFFHYADNLFAAMPLLPTLGNHEYPRGDEPRFYHDLFALPENGTDAIPMERSYHFSYGNALFVVLDSNLSVADQTEWLDRVLGDSEADWKFVMYHHPAYSSRLARDNADIRDYWTPLFDAHEVDIVFQGHDHAYMRTPPIRDQEVVDSPEEGAMYVIANAGTKYYDQDQNEYIEVGFEEIPTYQVIDIEAEGEQRLRYRAYDVEGALRDSFEIVK